MNNSNLLTPLAGGAKTTADAPTVADHNANKPEPALFAQMLGEVDSEGLVTRGSPVNAPPPSSFAPEIVSDMLEPGTKAPLPGEAKTANDATRASPSDKATRSSPLAFITEIPSNKLVQQPMAPPLGDPSEPGDPGDTPTNGLLQQTAVANPLDTPTNKLAEQATPIDPIDTPTPEPTKQDDNIGFLDSQRDKPAHLPTPAGPDDTLTNKLVQQTTTASPLDTPTNKLAEQPEIADPRGTPTNKLVRQEMPTDGVDRPTGGLTQQSTAANPLDTPTNKLAEQPEIVDPRGTPTNKLVLQATGISTPETPTNKLVQQPTTVGSPETPTNKLVEQQASTILPAKAVTADVQSASLTKASGNDNEADSIPNPAIAKAAVDAQQQPAPNGQTAKTVNPVTSLYQALEGAGQNSARSADLPALPVSMTALGEHARPAGMNAPQTLPNTMPTPQVPLNNIAVHISAQAKAGNHNFRIRLDPPELGRIDVRLEIGRDGQALTHLMVEKPETLDLLRQDARQLERALQDAGLDSREGALSFSLSEDDSDQQQAMNSDEDDAEQGSADGSDVTDAPASVIARTLNASSGLDISI